MTIQNLFLYAENINFNDIIDNAKKNNYLYQSQSFQLEAQKKQYQQSLSKLGPQINLNANKYLYSKFDNPLINTPNHELTVSFIQPVINLAAIANLQISKVDSNIQDLQFAQQEKTLILNIIQQYLNILEKNQTAKFTKSQCVSKQELYNSTAKQFEVGFVKRSDLLQVKAALDSASVKNLKAELELKNALENFKTLTGIKLQKCYDIDLNQDLPNIDINNFAAWKEQALIDNIDINIKSLNVEKSNLLLKSNKADFIPNLTLTANRKYDKLDAIEDYQISDNVGLQLQFSLLQNQQGNNKFIQAEQIKLHAASTLAELDHSKLEIETKMIQSFEKCLNLKSQVNAAQTNTVSALESLQAIKLEQNLGSKTILNILEAEETYSEAQLILLQSSYAYLFEINNLKSMYKNFSEDDILSFSKIFKNIEKINLNN